MDNIKHLYKVTSAWISIVYIICYAGVALFPAIRPGFMRYGLHMGIDTGRNILTFGTFVSGLIIWNIIAIAAVAIFVFLYTNIKK